jgi:protein-S-isoprenylcysteine O-methyltransferase Ste14
MAEKIIYYSLWIILYIIWFILGLNTKIVTKSKSQYKGKLSRYLLVFFLLISLILISVDIDNFFFRSSSTPILKLIGIFTLSFGCIIAIWARLILKDNWSGKVQILEGQRIITTGLYKFVRHPIYLGFSLCFLGSFLFKVNYGSLMAFLIMIPLHIIKANQEEKLLIQEFGTDYSEYIKSTKRLIPFIF